MDVQRVIAATDAQRKSLEDMGIDVEKGLTGNGGLVGAVSPVLLLSKPYWMKRISAVLTERMHAELQRGEVARREHEGERAAERAAHVPLVAEGDAVAVGVGPFRETEVPAAPRPVSDRATGAEPRIPDRRRWPPAAPLSGRNGEVKSPMASAHRSVGFGSLRVHRPRNGYRAPPHCQSFAIQRATD